MSLTVRFPTGSAVTYHNANDIRDIGESYDLYSDNLEKGGYFIVSVLKNSGAVIEGDTPRTVNSLVDPEEALKVVAEKITTFNNGHGVCLAEIKKALRNFDARTYEWKRGS